MDEWTVVAVALLAIIDVIDSGESTGRSGDEEEGETA